MNAMLVVAIVAIYSLGVSFIASGKSSLNDIQSIAHAAKPSPREMSGWNVATNKNAGTAISGCGNEEKMDRNTAFRGEIHFGTITDASASHSGIFWIAITNATISPNFRLGQKANHIAIPSVPECTVIIMRKRRSCEAVFPFVEPNVIFPSCA
jgi:hypothetical protein